jgi:hypothetical protein
MRLLLIVLSAVLAALLALAGSASAGTLTLNPSIQGAGKISSSVTSCQQNPGVLATAVLTCPGWQITNTGSGDAIALLTPTAAQGWKFYGWTDCGAVVNDDCKYAIPADAGWASTRAPRATFIDVTPPKVTFDPLLRWPNAERTVSVLWSADEAGVTFMCSLDGAPKTACTSPQVVTAAAGMHKYSVTATAPSGLNAKPVTIDVELLDTEFTGGPAQGSFTKATSASFDFKGGPSTECSLDGAAYTTCKPPMTWTGLADGMHTVLARSRDGDLVDPIPARRTWTVDTTAPETTLSLEDDAPTFSFSSSEPGSTFKCSLDGAAFAPCTAPRPAGGLALGEHEFAVKAVDRAGNEDPTPAKRRWTVEPPAPPAPPATPEPAPAPIIVAPAPRPGLSFRYTAGRKGTTFSRLAVTGLPAGAKLTVVVTAPHRRPRTLASLKPLVGKRLAPGTTIMVVGKTITIRRSRAPKVT